MFFAHPAWFAALALLPVLAGAAVLAARTRGRAWRVLVAPRLRRALVRHGSPLPRWLALAALLAALACLVGALARPQGAGGTRTETLRGRNVLLVIDLSRSMLVPDVSPSRLDQARAIALELLDSLPDDRIGVVAFAGTPFLVAPLTVDHAAVRETLQQLDPDTVPAGGSDLAGAVRLGAAVFRDNGLRHGALVLLSDGEEHGGGVAEAAAAADRAGLFVFAVGVGTPDGGFIPDPAAPDGRFRDREGNVVLSRLHEEPLRQLAGHTGGRFLRATSGSAFGPAVDTAIGDLERFDIDTRRRTVAIEFFQWLVLPAVLLIMAAIVAATNWRQLVRPAGAATAIAAATAVAVVAGVAARPGLLRQPGRPSGPRAGAPCCAALALPRPIAAPPPVTGRRATTPTAAAAPCRAAVPVPPTLVPCAAANGEPPEHPAAHRYADLAAKAGGEHRSRYRLAEGTAALASGDVHTARTALSDALLSRDPAVQAAAHHNLANTLVEAGWRSLADGQPYPGGAEAASRLDPLLDQRLAAWLADPAPETGASESLRLFESVLLAWADAVRHYDSAIAGNPRRDDSRHNREVAIRLLERLRKAIDQTATAEEEQLQPEPQPEPQPQPGEQGEQGDRQPQQGDRQDDQQAQPGGEEQQPPPADRDDRQPDRGQEGGEAGDQRQPDQPEDGERKQPTPEEEARRLLKDNADFERGPLAPGMRREFRRPAKDW